MSNLSHDTVVIQTGGQPEPGGVVEGGGRVAKHTQSRGEWWRGAGGQPSTLRAGRSGGRGRECLPSTLTVGKSGRGLNHYDIITVSEPQSVHLFFHW